ncbi:hypothetical protein [Absidia glauca]|uniref:Uncharacterized protein n=1 Tax=Absidia glauca TaxID=4829 RepID=A0A168PQG2_ABSGL|nr:hypothetical protein [Absidia glauca]
MHRHTLAFFFLALLLVTFAETYAPRGLDPGGIGEYDDPDVSRIYARGRYTSWGNADDPDAGGPDAGGPDAGGPDAGGPDAGGHGAGGHGAGGHGAGGFSYGARTYHGKRCSSVLDCGNLYCIDRICQEQQPGRDCVAKGSLYTGGMSCCPPMFNPRQVNTPCRLVSLSSCKSDRDCSVRNGVQYPKCCPDDDNGNGACVESNRKCK